MLRDEDLALGIQQGKLSDLSALVEQHHSPLLGFLFRMTGGDRTLAEDLVQETFLRVLRSISQYRYPRPFKPWLYMIATNITRDHYKRAETRHAVSMPEDGLDGLNQQTEYPEDVLLFDDKTRQIAVAMRRLPDHQREAVILRYFEELSLAEIAEILDVPVGTVKSRLSLGLRRLREMLVEQEV